MGITLTGSAISEVANDCKSVLSTLESISRAHSWEILMRKIKEYGERKEVIIDDKDEILEFSVKDINVYTFNKNDHVKVFVNGDYLGFTSQPDKIINDFNIIERGILHTDYGCEK